jgi:hypothetical protein
MSCCYHRHDEAWCAFDRRRPGVGNEQSCTGYKHQLLISKLWLPAHRSKRIPPSSQQRRMMSQDRAYNEDTSPIRQIVGNFETQWRPNWDVDSQRSGGPLFIVSSQNSSQLQDDKCPPYARRCKPFNSTRSRQAVFDANCELDRRRTLRARSHAAWSAPPQKAAAAT